MSKMTSYTNIIPLVGTAASIILLIGGLPVNRGARLDNSPINKNPSNHYLQPSDSSLGTFDNKQTKYRLRDDDIDLNKQIETIHGFASNILDNIIDLDPEFSRIIDENYWDLV